MCAHDRDIPSVDIPLRRSGNLHFLNAVKSIKVQSRTAQEWHKILCHINYKDLF